MVLQDKSRVVSRRVAHVLAKLALHHPSFHVRTLFLSCFLPCPSIPACGLIVSFRLWLLTVGVERRTGHRDSLPGLPGGPSRAGSLAPSAMDHLTWAELSCRCLPCDVAFIVAGTGRSDSDGAVRFGPREPVRGRSKGSAGACSVVVAGWLADCWLTCLVVA